MKNTAKEVLTKYRVVAVVGLSRDSQKYSHRVGDYLKRHGFQIIPVNPLAAEILGEKSYKSILGIPEGIQKTIEIVDIFRPSEQVFEIVEQVIELRKRHGNPYVVWLQLGIVSEKAARAAKEASILVVMDKCIMREHRLLLH